MIVLMHYEIATVKIRINNPSNEDLTLLEKFKSEPCQSSYSNITIKKAEQFNLVCNVLYYNNTFSVAQLPEGRNGYIFYSADKKPIASLMADTSWQDIEIVYIENIRRGKHKIIDHALRIAFNNIIIMNGGLIVHSSAVHYRNNGLIFSAPSGTGKSTHTSFWRKNFNAGIINDDTPALVFQDDKILVCGTPWSGSSDLFENVAIPLDAIVVLSRYHKNEMSEMPMEQSIQKLFPRCMFPYHNQRLLDIAFGNFKKIIERVPVYYLKCTPTPEAAETVKAYLNL